LTPFTTTAKQRLKDVFADVFQTSPEAIRDDMSIMNTAAWDSMQSIVLATSVESEFDIEFTDVELATLDSFAKILFAIESRDAVDARPTRSY
jgi:acyl carrier protein